MVTPKARWLGDTSINDSLVIVSHFNFPLLIYIMWSQSLVVKQAHGHILSLGFLLFGCYAALGSCYVTASPPEMGMAALQAESRA